MGLPVLSFGGANALRIRSLLRWRSVRCKSFQYPPSKTSSLLENFGCIRLFTELIQRSLRSFSLESGKYSAKSTRRSSKIFVDRKQILKNAYWKGDSRIIRLTRSLKQFAVASLALLATASGNAIAGEDVNGGDDFRQAAMEYREEAEFARERGMTEDAAIYDRLAEIKLEAAGLADEGRWDEIDWSEYHELNEKLAS